MTIKKSCSSPCACVLECASPLVLSAGPACRLRSFPERGATCMSASSRSRYERRPSPDFATEYNAGISVPICGHAWLSSVAKNSVTKSHSTQFNQTKPDSTKLRIFGEKNISHEPNLKSSPPSAPVSTNRACVVECGGCDAAFTSIQNFQPATLLSSIAPHCALLRKKISVAQILRYCH
jgi:hypothetical protein